MNVKTTDTQTDDLPPWYFCDIQENYPSLLDTKVNEQGKKIPFIMTDPVLLDCGCSIDRSTVEKVTSCPRENCKATNKQVDPNKYYTTNEDLLFMINRIREIYK